MATVRFSGELKTQITNSARNIYTDRINKAKELNPTWGDRFYELAFGSYKEQLAKIDPAWLKKGTQFSIRADVPSTNQHGVPCTIQIREELPLTTSRPVPIDTLPRHMTGCEIHTGYTPTYVMKDPRFEELLQEMVVRFKNIQALEMQRDSFVNGIKTVLDAHATLAPALRAFPPLWDLLSDSVKEKHKEVKVIERKSEVVINADLAALNAAMAVHKMTR